LRSSVPGRTQCKVVGGGREEESPVNRGGETGRSECRSNVWLIKDDCECSEREESDDYGPRSQFLVSKPSAWAKKVSGVRDFGRRIYGGDESENVL